MRNSELFIRVTRMINIRCEKQKIDPQLVSNFSCIVNPNQTLTLLILTSKSSEVIQNLKIILANIKSYEKKQKWKNQKHKTFI